MKKYQLLAAIFCSLTSLAHAAEEPILDEIVVTATRIEQPLKQTLSSTTVITQEDIQNSQATDVPTILRTVAGVEVSQTGGMGKSSSLFLRGSSATQVLVLLDGVRISSATLGTIPIEHLVLDQIERIEIVRGNVSSLYGSEAIGGVVQIFTKRNHGKPSSNITIGNGSLGTQRISAGLGNKVDNTDFHIQISKTSTNGVSSINTALKPAANPDNDGYDNTSVSSHIRQRLNDGHSLSLSAFSSLGHNQYDSAFGVNTDINTNDAKITKYSMTMDNRISSDWQSKLQLAQGSDFYQDFKNGAPVTPASIFKTTNRQANWQNTLQLGTANQLLVGMEHLSQQVYTDRPTAYLQDTRIINSLYAGHTGKYGAHQLQTNLRKDNNSQYGAANTGLLGYGYAVTDALRLSTSYSTGFRAPTFNNLYYPGSGNPNIRPEKSRNLEAGIHFNIETHTLGIVYFDNRIIDLIQYLPPTYQVQNVGKARIDGIEMSYAGQFDDTGLKAAITVQDPRNITDNKQLDRRAKTHGSLIATQQLSAIQLRAEWLYSDERPDSNNMLNAYHVFSLGLNYALSKETILSLRANNLTDQNDSNAYGYNPLGRTFFASLSYQQ